MVSPSHSQAPLLLIVKKPWKGLWAIGGGSKSLDSHSSIKRWVLQWAQCIGELEKQNGNTEETQIVIARKATTPRVAGVGK